MTPPATATAVSAKPAANQNPWAKRARYFNSGNAFALELAPVPSVQFTAERDAAFDAAAKTGLIAMDLSDALQTPYPATTPLVLSRYLVVRANETLTTDLTASAQTVSFLKGSGEATMNGESCAWQSGDVLLLPGGHPITYTAQEDTVAWLVTDEPALAFMGLAPRLDDQAPVAPVHYSAADLEAELESVYAHPDVKNFAGYAVVLSHDQLEHTRNLHPTMTLALNTLPAGEKQRPHVHNAMALTLCLQGEGVHSVVDGQRKDWEPFAVMVTPPGASHSHVNEGSHRMRSLVIQDGALHYYTRTNAFSFVEKA